MREIYTLVLFSQNALKMSQTSTIKPRILVNLQSVVIRPSKIKINCSVLPSTVIRAINNNGMIVGIIAHCHLVPIAAATCNRTCIQALYTSLDGFQMSIKRSTSGGQACAQEAAVQQIFHLERSSFFYLSALMVRTQHSAY